MKAGIIAAGEGSRLRRDGIQTLKPLVEVNGKPIIERLLLQFHSFEITEVFCIINEESGRVRHFVESKNLPLSVHFRVKSTESSMHSLFELSPYLEDSPFLLSTVDSVFDTSELGKFIEAARSSRDDGLLAVAPYSGDEKPLWVETNDADLIVGFRETPTGNPLVTGGLYYFSPRIFDAKNEALQNGVSRLRNFLSLLLEKGYMLRAYRFTQIIDLDHAEDIRVAERFLQSLEPRRLPV